jgi:hypothetical protein
MGYSVYITRRKSWADSAGPSITEQEWLVHQRGDSDLAALFWRDGNVEANNPSFALVRKMALVAAALHATVQGDDGELYDGEGRPVQPPHAGFFSRVASWVVNQLSPGATPVAASSLPFKVGDRVRDKWGNLGKVTEIDVRAAHGLGRITVKFEDGRTLSSAAIAHGLERADA